MKSKQRSLVVHAVLSAVQSMHLEKLKVDSPSFVRADERYFLSQSSGRVAFSPMQSSDTDTSVQCNHLASMQAILCRFLHPKQSYMYNP
jgi:hypothetical protein